MKKLIYIFLIFLFSCNKAEDSLSSQAVRKEVASEMVESENTQSSKISLSDQGVTPGTPQSQVAPEPVDAKIIKTAHILIQVENYEKSLEKIKHAITKWGGYVSSENEENTRIKVSNKITIRVPNSNFNELVAGVVEPASKVERKEITAIDVSEEYIDVQARLKAKRNVEERYLEILQKAKTIEDILKVENQLKNIREEIERMEGRLRYLNNKISYSTINLTIYKEKEYKYEPEEKNDFFENLLKALDKGWQGFLSFIIGIAYLWPLILAIFAGIFIFKKIRRKK